MRAARRQDALRTGDTAMKMLLPGLLCAMVAVNASAQQAPDIPRFSTMKPAAKPPPEWKDAPLSAFKKHTDYSLVTDDGVVVLRAVAHGSASGLAFTTEFDPHKYPMLSWRWKVAKGIPDANNADPTKEDSPLRVIVHFDGDTSKLSAKDTRASSTAKFASGRPLPYAMIMYIWGNQVAIDSVTTSSHYSRIKMLALSTDDKGVGKWQSFTRNLVDDYKRAFGEEPGNVISIDLLTDTDNTNADAEAYYGDISVGAAKP
jgi:hypothetical protein